MNAIKKSWNKAGYDQEEAYFFERDQELIKKQRERPKLTLIKGGKDDSVLPEKISGQKKAA